MLSGSTGFPPRLPDGTKNKYTSPSIDNSRGDCSSDSTLGGVTKAREVPRKIQFAEIITGAIIYGAVRYASRASNRHPADIGSKFDAR